MTNSRIDVIEILHGGITNSNYKVTIDGVTYALRLAGVGTIEYINRGVIMRKPVKEIENKSNCSFRKLSNKRPIFYLFNIASRNSGGGNGGYMENELEIRDKRG